MIKTITVRVDENSVNTNENSEKFNVSILTHVNSLDEAIIKIKYIRKYFSDITIIPCPKAISKTKMIQTESSILIDDYARLDYIINDKNSFTLYLSNDIKVDRINLNTNDKLRNLKKYEFDLTEGQDIVINGLCFCKVTKPAKVIVYVKENALVFVRNNLI